jgi:hypothetical protein
MIYTPEATDSSRQQGTIYTFYSYKGGVGRSMALANLAEIFHEKDLRVVMIDWDLEAPGLETYFYSTASENTVATVRARRGLMDLLLEYRRAYPSISARRTVAPGKTDDHELQHSMKIASALAAELSRDRPDLPEFLRKNPFVHPAPASFSELLEELYRSGTSFDPTKEFPRTLATSPLRPFLQCIHSPTKDLGNGLYLISAGDRGGDQFAKYALAVQEFDWADFYAAYDGHQYFTWFRDRLAEMADVVLIDSRTGVTEMGGVCTRHLADVVVSFCAPNAQNLEGIPSILSGLNRDEVKQARGGREIKTVVVPSRIDTSESDRLNDFSSQFASKIENSALVPEQLEGLERPFWGLQIPYIPRYNYSEERVIGAGAPPPGEVGQKLLDAYQRIAVHLADLSPEGSRPREAYTNDINAASLHLRSPLISRPRQSAAGRQRVFISYSAGDSQAAKDLASGLRQVGVDVWLDIDRLRPGDRWAEKMEEGLKEATALVVYVGKSGVRTWFDREARVALDRSIQDKDFRLVPVLGPGADPDMLPLYLKQYQWLDLRKGLTDPAQLNALIEVATQHRSEGISLLPPDRPPFLGLKAFDVEHSLLFYGRDTEVEQLVDRIKADGFLAIVGASGSGKSSLVRAGLIPALHRGRFPESSGDLPSWKVIITRPTENPFSQLAAALRDLYPTPPPSDRTKFIRDVTRQLGEEPVALSKLLAMLVPVGSRALLVVDQFEELFTLTRSAEERLRYVGSILSAADVDTEQAVHVVIILRADFYSQCFEYPELRARIVANQYNLQQISGERLREVIEKPIALVGAKLEPGLVDTILSDLGDEPGNLPMLQHALLQLWERREGHTITHRAYNEIGRLSGALQSQAERSLAIPG